MRCDYDYYVSKTIFSEGNTFYFLHPSFKKLFSLSFYPLTLIVDPKLCNL